MRLAVVSDSEAVAEMLESFVLPWLPREAIDEQGADRLVEVRRARAGAGFEVLIDGAVADEAPTALAAIPSVQRALDEALVRQQTLLAVVHSGVVAHQGRAIVLPGPTGTGKSTLVAELVRRGAAYLSDEYAFIDAAGRVHPYPRPLLLRDGSGDRPVLASDLGGTVAREPIPVGLIVAFRHAAGVALTLTPVSQGDGVLLLLRNTPQALLERPWIVAPLEHAVEGAACYVGVRGEAQETVAAILELAGSKDQQPA